jgi:flagellar motor protein MotB
VQRLSAVGYGYSRPKVQPDLVNGNPENRRVEIYIRGAGTNADKVKYVNP